ncbi:MAG: bifunctional hydroxymethylpyrimidine kinase/phosphomethylpyrimidine kinase [Pyrinomonadaceae bacterium]
MLRGRRHYVAHLSKTPTGVFGAAHQTAEVVRAQILPLVEDFQIAGVKTGMLPTAEIIEEVARLLRETSLAGASGRSCGALDLRLRPD